MSESDYVDLGDADSLGNGETMTAEAFGVEVLVARVEDGYFAVANMCTHAAGWLDMGELHPDTLEIGCPLHDGRFDLRTGAATREPCTIPVRAFNVFLKEGRLLVQSQ